MGFRKIGSIVLVFGGFSGFLGFFVVVFFASILLLSDTKMTGNMKRERGYSYKYYERNGNNNDSSFGVVSLPNELKTNEYGFSSRKFGNKSILISNFGYQEYECLGSCYCEEVFGDRRKILSVGSLSRGITYLLVAVSSVVAIKIAEDFFRNECVERISETCNLGSVESVVEDCVPITEEDQDISFDDELQSVWSRKEETFRVYQCIGNCMENKKLKNEMSIELMKEFNCEKLKQEGEIIVYENEVLESRAANIHGARIRVAKRKFRTKYLTEFCRHGSTIDMAYLGRNKWFINGVERDFKWLQLYSRKDEKRKNLEVCVGHGRDKINVHCHQILPELTANSKNYLEKKWKEKRRKWKKQ